MSTVFFLLFKNIFYLLCYYSCPIISSPLFPSALHSPPTSIPHPHPLVHVHGLYVHISSSASTFPILFLTSPCLFHTYHLCFLFPVPFPPFTSLTHPADNPPCDLHFCDSVPVLVVCLVYFCFLLFCSVVDICEFVVILLFIFLIIFFS